MGSLPNLHELGKDSNGEESGGYKPGPALGHLCGGCNGAATIQEKSKISQRYSGHPRITKARSNPHDSHKIIYDDFTVEHMASYSPVSARSRFNLNFQNMAAKRRDSMNSSIGATSVRRLLAVVRGGTHGNSAGMSGGPIYTRRVLLANLVVICMCHIFFTAAYLPFLALQSSVSVWVKSSISDNLEINTGSLLVSEMYFVAAVFALLAPVVVKCVGASVVILICYGVLVLCFVAHIYPILYITIPVSSLFGISLGLLSCAHISFLMILSHRITGLFHEEDEDCRVSRRTCVIRRVARAFQGAHDVGLIIGSVLSALLVTYTVNINIPWTEYENGTASTDLCSPNTTQCENQTQVVVVSTNLYDYNAFLDDIFDCSEDRRLCGAQACRISSSTNTSLAVESGFRILPTKSAEILVGVYAGACGAAFLLAAFGLDRIKMLVHQDPLERGASLSALRATKESFRDIRLQMAAPLAVFIGLEQAFIYADFSKSYVVCTLGVHRLNLVFLSMGLLQSIAACTLSMLLKTIRRWYVVAVGFAFHSCLIMVLLLWKPSEDDPALFYVISASWGVCNSIWEMMIFTFLTSQYSDNWESAFANMAFFRFIGLSLAFVLHGYLCNYIKLYVLAFVMFVSVVSFGWLEVRLENVRKVKNIVRL